MLQCLSGVREKMNLFCLHDWESDTELDSSGGGEARHLMVHQHLFNTSDRWNSAAGEDWLSHLKVSSNKLHCDTWGTSSTDLIWKVQLKLIWSFISLRQIQWSQGGGTRPGSLRCGWKWQEKTIELIMYLESGDCRNSLLSCRGLKAVESSSKKTAGCPWVKTVLILV